MDFRRKFIIDILFNEYSSKIIVINLLVYLYIIILLNFYLERVRDGN